MKIDLTKTKSYFINLDRDAQRKKDLEDWHDRLNFLNPVRIPGVGHIFYWYGLSQAVINAIEFILKEDQGPFLLFEDDAMPMDNFYKDIEIPDDADAVWLGFSNWGYDPFGEPPQGAGLGKVEAVPGFSDVYRATNILTTHAVLHINPAFSRAVVESASHPDSEMNIDVKFVADGLFEKYNIYAIGPLFYQNEQHKPLMLEATRDVNIKDML
jgi:hypothetical protein